MNKIDLADPLERLKIYQKALIDWASNPPEEYHCEQGFCYYLMFEYEDKVMIEDLPELAELEPLDNDNIFWWPPGEEGKADRMACLDEAIFNIKIRYKIT